MTEPKRIVIIGAGMAGATAAGTLREEGFEGEVLLLGSDLHRPYELPALSKKVLLGDADEPEWVHDEHFYVKREIDLRRGVTATKLELGARVVHDSHGGQHRFDRLLLAMGARPRALRVPGADLPGLHTLRTLDDSLELRAAFEAARHVVIVGAGWIGCEAAAAARSHGADVTVIEPQPLPLVAVLGDEVATVFRDLHAERGVQWRLGTGVTEFLGTDTVESVLLTDGTEIEGDCFLVAVGAAPRAEIARAAGLEMADDGSVHVDAGLRTAASDIYAAGDVAAHFHPRYGKRVRVEHWANAKNQGAHVARNLIGDAQPYLRSPYFFTDQYDLGCEYRGLADPDLDDLVIRGDLATREFTAFWLHNGRVAAAMNVNMWDDADALKELVDAQAAVTPEQVREAELTSLVPS